MFLRAKLAIVSGERIFESEIGTAGSARHKVGCPDANRARLFGEDF